MGAPFLWAHLFSSTQPSFIIIAFAVFRMAIRTASLFVYFGSIITF